MRGDELDAWLELSRDADPLVRRRAVQHLCPCHVKANIARVWDRVIELSADPDASVRRSAVHALGDGSPAEHRQRILAALKARFHDEDRRLRRMVRRLLAHHTRTGQLNIL